jgi:thiamine biosynthesis lipoprotein
MNRREFLHPRHIANVAGPVLGIADELQTQPPSSDAPTMLRFARRAMATTFEVILPFDAPSAHAIGPAALDEIDRLEAQLTVYRASSDVSRLNARAADQPVRVERNLFDLLALAQRIHRETDGAFDITVGALIKTWGFYQRQGRVPTPAERAEVQNRIGFQHVVLDVERSTVSYQRRGFEINLGSIGKGYALDRAAILDNVPNVLLHGGHSSVLALGDETPTQRGWTIGLTDPQRPECRRGLLHLRNRGMATSAITYQQIEHEGRKLGHLLDPRTAWPAEGMLSATVTAPTAAEADALATAFFILGVDKTRGYCEGHPEIGAALIAGEAPGRMVVLGRALEEVDVLR